MKKQNDTTPTIPPQIQNSLLKNEEILFVDRTIHQVWMTKVFPWMFLTTYLIMMYVFWNFRSFNTMRLFLTIIISVMMGVVFIMFNKFKLDTTYYLVVSSQKLYYSIEIRSNPYIETVALSDIKAITYDKWTTLKDGTIEGTIEIIADNLLPFRRGKLKFPHTKEINKKLQILNSILWNAHKSMDNENAADFGYVQDKELWTKLQHDVKSRNNGYILILIIILGGLISWLVIDWTNILHFNELNSGSRISIILPIYFGSMILLFASVYTFTTNHSQKKVLGDRSLLKLRIKENRLVLNGDQFEQQFEFMELFNFQLNLTQKIGTKSINSTNQTNPSNLTNRSNASNLTQQRNLQSRYNPPKFVGGIVLTDVRTQQRTLFGPIDQYGTLLGAIYKNFLQWNANRGNLLSQSEIERLYSSTTTKFPSSTQETRKFESISQSPESLDTINQIQLTTDQKTPFMKYIQSNEPVFAFFQPEIEKSKYTWMMIGGIGCIIATIIIANLSDFFFGIFLMLPGMFLLIFGGILRSIASMANNSKYCVTDQKILAKYQNRMVEIAYKNIVMLQKMDQKDIYQIQIQLKNDVENNPYAGRMGIWITHIPQSNDLYNRIKQLYERAINRSDPT